MLRVAWSGDVPVRETRRLPVQLIGAVRSQALREIARQPPDGRDEETKRGFSVAYPPLIRPVPSSSSALPFTCPAATREAAQGVPEPHRAEREVLIRRHRIEPFDQVVQIENDSKSLRVRRESAVRATGQGK